MGAGILEEDAMLTIHHASRSGGGRSPFARFASLGSVALVLLLMVASGCGRKSLTAPTVATTAGQSRVVTPALVAQSTRHLFVGREEDDDGRPPVGHQTIHLTGTGSSGALWVIDKPADWNGSLVLYLHGYTNPALPIALPGIDALRDSLLNRGYAVAASSYSSNGFAAPEGIRDSRELGEIFRERVARPRHTYLVGTSLGGLIGLLMVQRWEDDYDGALLVSGLVGSSREEIQYMGDIRALFDAVYPGVLPGGLEHSPALVDPQNQLINPVLGAIQANPQGLGIIQALSRRPLPGNNAQEIVASLINVLGFAMQGGADLYQRCGNTSFFDNADWHYDSPAVPAPIVAAVNASVARFTPSPQALQFLRHYGEASRDLERMVVTIHATRDPVVPVWHEDILAQVAPARFLDQQRVDTYGHATFSAAQIVARFGDLIAETSPRGLVASR
jgi:pimeloyl-ACP methyl ester carboxylesterase